jgi:hypothetical protein
MLMSFGFIRYEETIMTEPSKHLKKFAFSAQLFQDMFTQGWEIGTDGIVRCTQGLPNNAKFEWCELGTGDVIFFVYSHPTWPVADNHSSIPEESILFTKISLPVPRK